MAPSNIEVRSLHSSVSGTALGTAVQNALALIVTAIGFVMTRGIDAVSAVFIEPAFALATVGADFVLAFFGSPLDAFGGAWDYALYSVTEGSWAFFGPATPIVIVGSALGTFTLYLYWADKFDVDSPTAGDIPFVNLDESGVSEED